MSEFEAALCLALELINHCMILNHQIGKKFQRDIALQFFVARQPHNPHPASPEDLDQGVATKHLLSAGSIQRRLKKATGAASVRRVDRNFGSALLANSMYSPHFRRRSRALLFYCAEFLQRLRLNLQNR